jgi:hypothetical protein
VHVVSDIVIQCCTNAAPAVRTVRNQMPWFLALFVIDHLVNVGDIYKTRIGTTDIARSP